MGNGSETKNETDQLKAELEHATEHLAQETERVDALPELTDIECRRKLVHVRELLIMTRIFCEAVGAMLLRGTSTPVDEASAAEVLAMCTRSRVPA